MEQTQTGCNLGAADFSARSDAMFCVADDRNFWCGRIHAYTNPGRCKERYTKAMANPAWCTCKECSRVIGWIEHGFCHRKKHLLKDIASVEVSRAEELI